jgi:hypothetical protein
MSGNTLDFARASGIVALEFISNLPAAFSLLVRPWEAS